jgi:enterochelin esterase-like enzyme
MAVREADGPVGAPWRRPLAGSFDELAIESELLAANPLGDSARRPLYVYRSPGLTAGATARGPAIYMLQGFAGQLDTWLARKSFEQTTIERIDALFAGGEAGEAVVVFVDAWTSRGGSQFLNSSSTGRYMDYLCDEVVPFIDERYPTLPQAQHRGLVGGSSGGYGAMVVSMLRPDTFGALASIAGDALFECCYQRGFPAVARQLRDGFEGSYEVFFSRLAEAERFEWSRFGLPLEMYGYACCYSPDPARPGHALLPFEVSTGRLVEDVWELWLERDPVRMAANHADALRGMRRIVLEAGNGDEYFLDLAAQAVAAELSELGVEHTLELFEGAHGGMSWRYPGAIRELVVALTP